ncbi:MAG: DUF2950 domain-containing protein, partial [Actinobacteria bacterium]|nr:DUF2950 domain-containing protein [Actinomycetota bacterium]
GDAGEEFQRMVREPDGLKEAAEMLGLKEEEVKKLTARQFLVRMMARMAVLRPEPFEREMGKYRDGAITGKKVDGDWCVLKVKSKDKEEEAEFVREGGRWYLSMAPQRRASNQRNAQACLKTLATAQVDFRSNDRDNDRVNNFWVKDVAGLYGIETSGEAIKLIMLQTAQADRTAAKGAYPSVKDEKPQAGHHFAALKRYREGGKAIPYDDGKGRNVSRFGFVAWPVQYPSGGRMTYIINEGNTVYQKDTGGKTVEEYPEDPRQEGWAPID